MVPRVLKPAVSASRAQVRMSAPVAEARVEGKPMPISMPWTLLTYSTASMPPSTVRICPLT